MEKKSFGYFLEKAQRDLQMSLTLSTINEVDYTVTSLVEEAPLAPKAESLKDFLNAV